MHHTDVSRSHQSLWLDFMYEILCGLELPTNVG